MTEPKFWIAINGPSCALSAVPRRNPIVYPTPERLIGFPTLEEAMQAQHICLTRPIEDVKNFFASLAPAVKAGKIIVWKLKDPDPHTSGRAVWIG